MHRFAAKRTEISELKKTRRRVFDRQSGVHWSCYVLLLTDFVNFGRSRLVRLIILVAFINSTRWIGSCVPVVRNRLIVCQYTVRHGQDDRLSQQQLSF